MKPPMRDDQFYQFKSRSQERIHKRFRDLLGEGSAAFYKDACILMEPKTRLDSSVHLVGHLFRELEGQLRSVLVEPGAGTEQAKGFEESRLADDVTPLKDRQDSVNSQNCTTHRDEIGNILEQLDIPRDHAVAKSWFKLTTKKNLRLPGYAHHKVLGRTKTWDKSFGSLIQEWEEVFYFVLEKFEERYATYHKRLDELLTKEIPEGEDIRQLRESIPNNIHAMHYFFDRLEKPGWLLPLHKAGFFVGPSEPEPEPETDSRVFPRWPPGPYLIRMAEVKPTQVMDIVLAVNDKLNPYVLYHLIEAATKMPHKEAARMVPKVKGWLQVGQGRSFMLNSAELVEYLARGGCIDESLDLLRELLSVTPFADESFPSSQFIWDYDYVIKKNAPTLIDISGLQALRLFCDLLDQALNLAWGNADKADGRDYSYDWRIQIEEEPDRRWYYELQNMFVTAVRDCTVRLVRSDLGLLSSVIDELERRRWMVFHRLALHLLCEFPTECIELISERLRQFRRYDKRHFNNEYYRLGLIAFPLLDPADQNHILNAIKEGPDISEVQRWMERSDKEITDEALQLEIRRSARNCLGELRPVLNESWTSFLDELERELGKAEPVVKPYRSYISWGSSEPQKVPEFGSMTVKDVVSFLESWGPLKGDSSRSPDHVWPPLCRAVTEAPEKFCQQISEFQRVDPTYVKHLFLGLREALREDHSFTWNPVLGLAEWVANSGRDIQGRSVDTFDWDADWGNTRLEMLELIHAGLEGRTGGIPYELRELVWKVLRPLTDDPEPTAHYEHEMIGPRKDPLPLAGGGHFLDSHMHPHGVAINTVRCLALRTVFEYAQWVRRNLSTVASNDELPVPGFAQMPEVRDVLDYHVDSRNDGSIAIGYVYGAEFRLIYGLDSAWAEENKGRIFSRAEEQRGRGAAAWEGYLLKNHAHQDGFDVLQAQYEQAVEDLGRPAGERGHFVNPDLRLGEHLCNFYLLGKICLGSSDSIWARFFARADDETLGALISGIGRETFNQKEFSKLWIEKFRLLWEWRIERIRTAKNPASHPRELKAFGTWFASGKFDDVWSLQRLSEVLEINDKISFEKPGQVVNRLANLADSFPGQVLDCVTRILKGISRSAMLHYWNEDLRKIVSITQGADDQVVRQKCGALKSILVLNGMDEYARAD